MKIPWMAVAALAAVAAVAAPRRAIEDPAVKVGESIYLRGVLGSGAELEGTRKSAGMGAKGAVAACVNCHQHSGLGSKEGALFIPPVTGEYLFHQRGHGHESGAHVQPYVESMHGNRDPYTDVTLARAIREGLDSQGRPLSDLMPRFALNDADMAALIEYLKSLSAERVPGVTDTVLHFATIFTPDSDPVKRAGVRDVLEHYFAEKNAFPFGPSPTLWTSTKTEYAKSMYMAHRRWQLHVWQLEGPAATWRAQLDKHLAQEPVFAVLSGLGGSNWAPVHEFCEQSALPCLFPNVEVPVVADGDFYPVYFSKGVLLESELLAKKILDARQDGGSSRISVYQVYRAGDSGEPAAKALAEQLQGQAGLTVHSQVLAGTPEQGLPKALRAAENAQVLVLWLRGPDLVALGSIAPSHANVYVSGLLGGLENAPVPDSWRARTELTYPFDLPDKRGVRLDYPMGWFSFRRIPVVALQAQADTYLACSLLTDVLNNHVADSFVRPYLVEQLQTMIERRIITGYYPHLALATNQRFASKGGYLAHFADTHGVRLTADGDWTVP